MSADSYTGLIFGGPCVLATLILVLTGAESIQPYRNIAAGIAAVIFGVWGGFLGYGSYTILLYVYFFVFPIVVGMISRSDPFRYGLLTNAVASVAMLIFMSLFFGHSADDGWIEIVMMLVPLLAIGSGIAFVMTRPIVWFRKLDQNSS